MTIAALLVLLVGLASVGVVAAARGSAATLAARFPGQPAYPGAPLVTARRWAAAAAAGTGLTLLALALHRGAGLVVSTAVSGVLIGLAALMVRYRRIARRIDGAVAAFAPRLAVPYAGKVGVHIGMWSPWIDRTGIPWCIVARTPSLFAELSDQYDVPIVQGLIPDSVRGALYPHGAAANTDFISASNATHVFLGHGDSDKPLSASERVLSYDIVAVAGEAAIDRFTAAGVAVPRERLRIIGRPQTEGIARGAGGPVSTVLYAPTWRHADDALDVSSLRVADRLVQALLDRGLTVVFRRHFAGQNHLEAEAMIARVDELLARDAASTGRAHRWGRAAMEEPLIDAFNSVDAMLSDISGIVVDFMASEKPLLMYATQYDDPAAFRRNHPTATAAYVVDRELRLLDEALDHALGDDPLAPERRRIADRFLGPQRDDPAGPFLALLAELAELAA